MVRRLFSIYNHKKITDNNDKHTLLKQFIVYSAFQSLTNNLFFTKLPGGCNTKTWLHNSWKYLLYYPPPPPHTNDIVPKFHARWSAILNLDFKIVLFHRLLHPVAQLSLSECLKKTGRYRIVHDLMHFVASNSVSQSAILTIFFFLIFRQFKAQSF